MMQSRATRATTDDPELAENDQIDINAEEIVR